jgi:hypothetical protein
MLPLSLTMPLYTARIEHSAAPLARRAFPASAALLAGLPHMRVIGAHAYALNCIPILVLIHGP